MAKKQLPAFQANIRIPTALLERIEAFHVPQESAWTPLTRSDRIVYVLGIGIEHVPGANGKASHTAKNPAAQSKRIAKRTASKTPTADKARRVVRALAAKSKRASAKRAKPAKVAKVAGAVAST